MREDENTRFELGTDGPKALVVGVDGSETAARAAAYATGLARRQSARVVFVFVRRLAGAGLSTPAVAAASAGTLRELTDELRATIEERMPEIGVPWEFRVAEGDAAAEISAVADEMRADGVVVGASTQAGHRIAGSIAVRLVRAGRWPVTVVP